VLSPGYVSEFSEADARAALSGTDVILSVALDQGPAEATVWTCDLTRAYVDINASYRT
jgi:glutamate N-acetyltransferase/amino-acid N-acetyltransferase